MRKNNPFDGLVSLSEAATMWGKEESGLRHAIARGKFKEGIDAKKFGKQWVIAISAMEREYGKITRGGTIKKYAVFEECCEIKTKAAFEKCTEQQLIDAYFDCSEFDQTVSGVFDTEEEASSALDTMPLCPAKKLGDQIGRVHVACVQVVELYEDEPTDLQSADFGDVIKVKVGI